MVLARVGKAKGQTLERGEHHRLPKVAQLPVLSFSDVLCYVFLPFKAEDAYMHMYMYIIILVQATKQRININFLQGTEKQRTTLIIVLHSQDKYEVFL
jgi:hypothetical protein